MKLEDIIYDVKTILRALKETTRVTDAYLIHKINNYRALLLQQKFEKDAGTSIPETYYSRLPNQTGTEVGSGDIPDGPPSSVKFGRFDIPDILPLSTGDCDKSRLIRVMPTSRQKSVYWTCLEKLNLMISGNYDMLNYFTFCFLESNVLYTYPALKKLDLKILLNDPLDGYSVKSSEVPLGSVVDDSVYVVISGSVTDGTTVYSKDDTFTADTTKTYSGDGKIKLYDQLVEQTMSDEYPIDRAMAQMIVLQILTNEYKLELRSIEDIYVDSQDQFRVATTKTNAQ